ncbi:MAG: selenocysteine-specific translation elongation factor [Acidimicrobiales bacterium]|jgi:selenocysteine-specific elongation factor|nr:selenocysteine-specific translation elongation factor [Acidimicrobiales bacterium]
MHVIATAGHVDHGKSTLVRALTGTDPDRLAEEKERGLTIDLGFAFTELSSGRKLSFVDVPGHIRFIKNMLAGVGGVDACLFVVAATEGWKPQSEEHLRILELLGIRYGVIALTQIGLVDDELAQLAHMDVEEKVEGSFLEAAEVVPVDSLNGTGIDALREALDRLTELAPTASNTKRPRLWVDRAFAATGAGSVVTGTLTGGRLRVDDEVSLVPGDAKARIRAVQTQGESRTKIDPGHRVALNLANVDYQELGRGIALVFNEQWHRTQKFDASIQILPSLSHDVSRRGAFSLYVGSGEWSVKIRVLGPSHLPPGSEGHVRIFLPEELPLLPGDRFVLRESGRDETVGGGHVLDVDPVTRASEARPDLSVDRVISERGWITVDDLERLTGVAAQPVLGNWVASLAVLSVLEEEVRELVEQAGPVGLDMALLDDRQRLAVNNLEDIEVFEGRARSVDQEDIFVNHPIVDLLEAEPFSPTQPPDPSGEEIRGLLQRGLLVQNDGVLFASSSIHKAAIVVAHLLQGKPEGVTVAEIRDALGTTRKFALPICAVLDNTGVTRRRDDLRIAGPRLPEI